MQYKPPIVYTVEKVAKLFGIREYTVREWIKRNYLPAKKIGKQWFFLEKDILKKLEERSM